MRKETRARASELEPETAADTVRVQFDIDAERLAEVDSLLEPTGLRSRRELFDNALALFEWAVNEARRGRQIASINEETNHYKAIVMPALLAAAKRVPRGLAVSATAVE